jgi:uncharacterized membrane protein YjjB (DUF3815 family)
MYAVKIITVLIIGAAIGILYRIPRGVLIYGSVTGLAAWLVTDQLYGAGVGIVTANFCGSLTVGFMAEILARALRKPSTIFIIPGFIPLVPGGQAYTTMRLLVEAKPIDALSMGIQTLLLAGAIAFGIFASVTIYRLSVGDKIKSVLGHDDKN